MMGLVMRFEATWPCGGGSDAWQLLHGGEGCLGAWALSVVAVIDMALGHVIAYGLTYVAQHSWHHHGHAVPWTEWPFNMCL